MTQTVLLGNFVNVIKGISYKSVDYCDSNDGEAFINLKCVERGGGFRFDGIKYYKGKHKPDQIVEPGDILIANTDLTQDRDVIGSPIIMPNIGRPACFSLDISKLKIISENLDKDYLFYYLKSPLARDYMIAHSNGSTVMHLSVKSVPSMPIEIPDIEIQKKIGTILKNIDEKIKHNRQINETLEQIGQTLFKHYFIDNLEAIKWEKRSFSYVVNIMTGKGSANSQLSEDGVVPLYGANGIMGTSQDYLYDEPLIITGRVGTLGAVRVVTGKSWFSDNVIIMQPKIGYFGFVYHLAKSFDYISMNRGSTQPLITQTDLKNIPILIPDINTLKKFETEYDSILNQIQNNFEEIKNLTILRDTLLPRLILGKIGV